MRKTKINHSRNSVWITPLAKGKMQLWASLAGKKGYEFTCWATTSVEDGVICVDDAHLVRHKGSHAAVEADDLDMAMLTSRLLAAGYESENINCWVHSHPGTGPEATYLSAVDEGNIARWLTGDFLVSIVWDSSGGNPYCRVDFKMPRLSVECQLIDDLRLDSEVHEAAVKEFEEKSRRAPVASLPSKAKGKKDSAGGNNARWRHMTAANRFNRKQSSFGFEVQQGYADLPWEDYLDENFFEEEEIEIEIEEQDKEERREPTQQQTYKIVDLARRLDEGKITDREVISEISQTMSCPRWRAVQIWETATSVAIDDEPGIISDDPNEGSIDLNSSEQIAAKIWSGELTLLEGCEKLSNEHELSLPMAVKILVQKTGIEPEDVEKELALAGLDAHGYEIKASEKAEVSEYQEKTKVSKNKTKTSKPQAKTKTKTKSEKQSIV